MRGKWKKKIKKKSTKKTKNADPESHLPAVFNKHQHQQINLFLRPVPVLRRERVYSELSDPLLPAPAGEVDYLLPPRFVPGVGGGKVGAAVATVAVHYHADVTRKGMQRHAKVGWLVGGWVGG